MRKKKKSRRQNVNDATQNKAKFFDCIHTLSVVVPLLAYILIIEFIAPAPNSGFVVMGFIGCLFLGMGFSTIVDYYSGTYMGSIFTIVPCVLGAALIATSSIILYVPSVYDFFKEGYVTFYFTVWIFLAVICFFYFLFRRFVQIYLQKNGISKSNMKKMMIGAKNFWWYDAVNDMFRMKSGYMLNKAFTIFLSALLVLHLLIGWLSAASYVIIVLLAICSLLSSLMWIWVLRMMPQLGDGVILRKCFAVICCLLLSLAMMYAAVKFGLAMWSR